MRTPGVIVVFSTALALLLLGLFGCVLVTATQVGTYLRGRILLHVYMAHDVSQQQLADAKTKMITQLSGLDQGTFGFELITKEQAAADFRKSSGEDFVNFLGNNPLRDYYEVSLPQKANTPENLEKAKLLIQKIPNVFEVTYLQSLAQNLDKNIRTGALVLGSLALLLSLAASALVSNTISLQLFGKRFIVRSMQLVGARPWFVIRPFLQQAVWLTGLSGAFASGALFGLYFFLASSLPDFQQFLSLAQLAFISGCIILAGLALGIATSYLTIRRYLRLSLDKLI
jgi:cell division transport system permease protein